jgi:sulfotransferase 6B1
MPDVAGRGTAWLARNWWTLQRFGLSPAKLPRRVLNRAEPAVLLDSVPKAGTHLLERALCLHPRLYRAILPTLDGPKVRRHGGFEKIVQGLRPGQLLVAHLPFRPEWGEVLAAAGVRTLVMVRDPRDVAISEAHFIAGQPDHWMHEAFRAAPDTRSRIWLAINGVGELPSLSQRFPPHMAWRDAGALMVRFEDLVGPEGGGSLDVQLGTLRRIYEHVGLPLDDQLLLRIRDGLFSDRSPTFRRGAIGQWRAAFDEETTELFNREAGDLLPVLGYSAD